MGFGMSITPLKIFRPSTNIVIVVTTLRKTRI